MRNCELAFKAISSAKTINNSYLELDGSALLEPYMELANSKFYDVVAGDYASSRAWTPSTEKKILINLVEPFKKYVGSSASVLVVGSGTGRDHALLEKQGYSCVGIDMSVPMVKESKKKIRDGLLFVSRGETLPFDGRSFDAVYCDAAAEHMDMNRLSKVLGEFRRVLRPRGHVLLGVREGSGNVVEVWDKVGSSESMPKYFSTFTNEKINQLFDGMDFDVLRQWNAQGGTPVAERSYPWINSIIQLKSEINR